MLTRPARLVALALATASLASCSADAAEEPQPPQQQEAQPAKQAVVPEGTPANPNLSPAIRTGDFVFASGALPAQSVGADIKAQVASALNALKSVFEASGTSMDNVVKCTVFLTDAADFAAMNEVYVTYFPKDPPARSTVIVAALVRADAKVEIECVAAMP